MDDETLLRIIPLIRERLVTLDECLAFGGFFFQEEVHPEPEELVGKEMSSLPSRRGARSAPCRLLSALPEISRESAEEPLRLLAEAARARSRVSSSASCALPSPGRPSARRCSRAWKSSARQKYMRRLQSAAQILEQAV